ncbi:translation elongation factor Ts [Brockia lithotrophica]|uniref:Elongation factor Ts n=1 Tax=Brockia lithotrophica TaxID=933949 RepID=A0A660KVR1_9BACL|nr:translation elongation factor Ts [Brockia lithotrophica]RKQ84217.1 translation elongation factor Ts (EF-Ts) [Brockia lithotrophica]
MTVRADQIKELRERTGAGFLDCKKALEEAGGDMERAIQILREKGKAQAAKKAGRIAAEGVVEAYIHAGGRIGVLVEVNCETDFVAKTEIFRQFAREIAMQIAAFKPRYVRREDVPAEVIERERAIYLEQAKNEGKPENIAARIAEGKLENFFKEVVLLEQPYIRDANRTVKDLLEETIAKTGEKVDIRRFVRYELGEGIERETKDFAQEVMSQLGREG